MGTGIYSLGTRAMFASQAMLDTTAHNISNVNTPGYSRQQVELATEGGMYTGAGFFGRGVRVATVTRSTNEFLAKEADRTASLAASDKTRLDKLEQLETTLPTGENGLGYAASQFLNGFVDVANRPQDMSARGVVLSRAQEWVNRVHVAGQQIEQLQAGVVSDMGTTIDQINDYTKQIASLNQDIAKYVGVGHTANDLLDQRDLLVNKLNKLVKVSTVEADDGSLSVFMGGGQLLVLSNQAQTLSLVRDPSNSSLGRVALRSNGTDRILDSSQTTGGALEGLLKFQDQDLAQTRADLNAFVNDFATAVNKQQNLGLTANGSTGTDFFAGLGPSSALTIQLNLSDPKDIAAAAPLIGYTADLNAGTAGIGNLKVNVQPLPAGLTAPLTVSFASDGSGGMNYEIYSAGSPTPYYTAPWTGGTTITDGNTPASFQLNVTGVPKIGDSLTLTAPVDLSGNNGNARLMLNLRDQNNMISLPSTGSSASLTDAYSQMIGSLGVIVQSGRTAAGISSTLETTASQTLASTNGVNLDEEASRLIQYQQSYQAAAKVLQVAQKVFDTLLNVTQ